MANCNHKQCSTMPKIPNTNNIISQVLVVSSIVKVTMGVGVTTNADRYLFIAAYYLMLSSFCTLRFQAPFRYFTYCLMQR